MAFDSVLGFGIAPRELCLWTYINSGGRKTEHDVFPTYLFVTEQRP